MKNLRGEILKNKKYSNDIYRMDIFSPFISKNAKPGQFVNIKCSPNGINDPLLRRPFSIYDVDSSNNVFSVLYQVIGKGTRFLSFLQPTDNIDLLGPLGKSIEVDMDYEKYLLIGGGIGIAPLSFIAKSLKSSNKKVIFAAGFRKDFPFEWENELSKNVDNYFLYTEDGSYGKRGKVTDCLEKDVESLERSKVYCCGPKLMLKSLQNIFKKEKVECTAIMEEVMACGTGVCLGCVIKIKNDNNEIVFKKVCSDGPGFDLSKMVF